jgi:hypothetical protein
MTSGGVLSVLIDPGAGQAGKLIAFDLNERRPLWSRSWSEDNLTYGPTAVGSVIVMARSGTVTGFAASTGAVRWVHGGGPSALGGVKPVAGPGNLVLLYDLLPRHHSRRPPRSPSTRRPGRSARPRPWRRRPLPRSPLSAVAL